MDSIRRSLMTFAAAAALMGTGCSDDAGADAPGGGAGGTGNGTDTSTGTGTGTDTGTATGTGTGTGTAPKPQKELSGEVISDTTLSADHDWLMKGMVMVRPGATLTIEPGTRILGEKVSLATLVVQPGGRIVADGKADAPIVFTSQAPPGERAAGDWGGVILLGRAPVNVPGGKANVEGITGEGTSYGGGDPGDDSGVLRYVRIEFSGILLSPDNEVNGLTLAGVGSKTVVDHVMVHHTLDDCFEFFGGTVNAKHLICADNGDDGFDWDLGYTGKLQFLAVRQDPTVADDSNGFEGDNDAEGSANEPMSEPTIYNVTLCGKNADVDKQQYGMLLRRSTRGVVANAIVTGFEAGVDVRDELTAVEVTNSIFFGNVAANIAYVEAGTDGLEKDDDGGFDEIAWILDPAAGNSEADPGIAGCFGAGVPDFRPKATLSDGAATPPDDGFFDPSAAFIGAFAAGDDWAEGAWVSYDAN